MRTNRITCTCARCGAVFMLKASAVARGYGRYCSLACRRLAKQPVRIDRVCARCGIAFQVFPSTVASGRGKFCSTACYWTAGRPQRRPLNERFWGKVNKNGPIPAHQPDLGPCWLWIGGHQGGGYGVFGIGRRSYLAHRVSYELAIGEPAGTAEVCHRCDTPSCVNPAHLFLGTHADNMGDAAAKARVWRARRAKGAITADTIQRLHALLPSHTQRDIAAILGISPAYVSLLKRRHY